MEPLPIVTAVRSAIAALIEKMNMAGAAGYKFDFYINTDPNTLQSTLTKFEVFKRMTLDEAPHGHH